MATIMDWAQRAAWAHTVHRHVVAFPPKPHMGLLWPERVVHQLRATGASAILQTPAEALAHPAESGTIAVVTAPQPTSYAALAQLWAVTAHAVYGSAGLVVFAPDAPAELWWATARTILDPAPMAAPITAEQLGWWWEAQWWSQDWNGTLHHAPVWSERRPPAGMTLAPHWTAQGWADGVSADGPWVWTNAERAGLRHGIRLWPLSVCAAPEWVPLPLATTATPLPDTIKDDQLAAIRHHTGPALVLAPAGSGKTTVLMHRVARLIREGVPPDRILALTFTTKAAGEMQSRLAGMVGATAANAVMMQTYHALAYRLLGTKRVLEGAARAEILRRLCQQVKIKPAITPDDVDQYLAFHANALVPVGHLDLSLQFGPKEPGLLKIAQSYEEVLAAQGATDFDSLLTTLYQRLRDNPTFRAQLQARWWFVLVDEYQDNNLNQDVLTRFLAAPHGHVMWVGDDDQVLYSFRGADVRRILQLGTSYPALTTRILTRNYRSVPTVVNSGARLIAHNRVRYAKQIDPVRPHTGPAWQGTIWETAVGEARGVAGQIIAANEAGVPWDACAVLLRTHTQVGLFVGELIAAGVPFWTLPKNQTPHPLETLMGQAVLAYIEAAQNPEARGALRTAWTNPERFLPHQWIGLTMTRPDPWKELALWVAGYDGKGETWRTEEAKALLSRWPSFVKGVDAASWKDAVHRAIDTFGLDHLATKADSAHAKLVTDTLTAYESLADAKRATAMLRYRRKTQNDPNGRVAVLTVHAAKGKEWPHVWLPQWIETAMPHAESASDAAGLEEERRIAYVAITRARDHLWVSGYKDGSIPSRFWTEAGWTVPAHIPDPVRTVTEPVADEDLPDVVSGPGRR